MYPLFFVSFYKQVTKRKHVQRLSGVDLIEDSDKSAQHYTMNTRECIQDNDGDRIRCESCTVGFDCEKLS